MKIFLFILLLAMPASLTAQSVQNASLCDLIKSPKNFDGKLVKVSAYYASGHHGASLYDPDCLRDNDGFVHAGEESSKKHRTSAKTAKTLERLTAEGGTSVPYVTAIGRFHDWNGQGYGELQKWTYEFAVMAISKVSGRPAPVYSEPGPSIFRLNVASLQRSHIDWSSVKRLGNWRVEPECLNAPKQKHSATLVFLEGKEYVLKYTTIRYACPRRVICAYQTEERFEDTADIWKAISRNVTPLDITKIAEPDFRCPD